MIVKIIPKIKLPLGANSVFDYEVPKELEGKIKIGQMVEVGFRRGKVEGVVLEIPNNKSQITNKFQILNSKFQTKPILEILDGRVMLYDKQIEIIKWMSGYYFAPMSLIVKMLVPDVPKKKLRNKEIKKLRDDVKLTVLKSRLDEIKRAIDGIKSAKGDVVFQWDDLKEKILVYIKLIESCLVKNQQVLILLPQIGDIEFLRGFLGAKFGSKLAILHGQMGKIAQYANWAKIRENKAKIVLATRSGILAPFSDLGLVIVDEEESADHKQYDMNPRYDVRRVVERLGKKVVFSSSAPRVETRYKVQDVAQGTSNKVQVTNKFQISNSKVELVRLMGRGVRIELVDMLNELGRGEYSPVSLRMEQEMGKILDEGKKVVLFLNRKGMATMTVCKDCKFLFKCEKCGLPMVYHETREQLVCHHCGEKRDTPRACPKCQGQNIKFVGTGTERIEKEVRKLFPGKKAIRIDKDATYYKIDINKYDIIIGTQLLLKDFKVIENLGMVGIVSLDILMQRPDFRASEKLYQLVSKLLVWARFNRCEKFLWQSFLGVSVYQGIRDRVQDIGIGHQVIRKSDYGVRTGAPQTPGVTGRTMEPALPTLIELIARQDYERFFERELEFRGQLYYPPFCKLVKFIYKDKKQSNARARAERLVRDIRGLRLSGVQVIGPIEPWVKQVRGRWIFEVVLKVANLDVLKGLPIAMLKGWLVDVEPESID